MFLPIFHVVLVEGISICICNCSNWSQNLSLPTVPWINFYSSNRAAAVSAAMPRMVTLVVTIAKILKCVVMDIFAPKSTRYLNALYGDTGGHN